MRFDPLPGALWTPESRPPIMGLHSCARHTFLTLKLGTNAVCTILALFTLQNSG